jgi:glycosyltransferase involved in cell wall biosynthesis
MKFSVVVPTFNRADILRQCLAAFAAQTYHDFEVIVIDDGSTDNTKSIARSFPFVRYFEQAHSGSAKLINIGWRNATGDIVLTTDDDCIGPANWLETLAAGFHRYPEAVAVGTYAGPPAHLIAVNRFARYDDWEWRFYGGRLTEYIGRAETPTAGLVAYKRFVFDEVGGFNEQLMMAGAHDHDMKQRLTALGYQFVYLPLKIDHYKEYSARSFRRQHVGRGHATARYQATATGRSPGYGRIALRAGKSCVMLGKDLAALHDKTLAYTIFQARWFNAVGQWQEESILRHHVWQND